MTDVSAGGASYLRADRFIRFHACVDNGFSNWPGVRQTSALSMMEARREGEEDCKGRVRPAWKDSGIQDVSLSTSAEYNVELAQELPVYDVHVSADVQVLPEVEGCVNSPIEIGDQHLCEPVPATDVEEQCFIPTYSSSTVSMKKFAEDTHRMAMDYEHKVAEVQHLKEQVVRKHARVQDMKKQINKLNKQLDVAQNQLAYKEENVEALKMEIHSLQKQVEVKEQKLEATKTRLAKKEAEVNELKEKLQEYECHKADLQRECELHKGTKEELQRERELHELTREKLETERELHEQTKLQRENYRKELEEAIGNPAIKNIAEVATKAQEFVYYDAKLLIYVFILVMLLPLLLILLYKHAMLILLILFLYFC